MMDWVASAGSVATEKEAFAERAKGWEAYPREKAKGWEAWVSESGASLTRMEKVALATEKAAFDQEWEAWAAGKVACQMGWAA